MITFPKYLKYEDDVLCISLQLDSYKTFILGNSSTGKSFMANRLHAVKQSEGLQASAKVSFNWDRFYVCLDSRDLADMYELTDSIILLDRLDFYIDEKLSAFIRNSNNIFILISRSGVDGVNTTYENLKVLKVDNINDKLYITTRYALSSEVLDEELQEF